MILSVFVVSALPVFALLSAPVEVPFVVRECSLPSSDAITLDPAELSIVRTAQGAGPWSAGSSKSRARLSVTPLSGGYFIGRELRPP